jgi:D-sedoheptulose 7-phosphate isomerase
MEQLIEGPLRDVADLACWMARNPEFRDFIVSASRMILHAFRNGGKVLACGNGGSAADAQHFVGELVGRYGFDRPPLAALALNTDTSVLTAVGNDYGFDRAFARQVLAHASAGDVLVAFSTSGSSPNVLAACSAGRQRGTSVIGFTGSRGDALAQLSDLCLAVPSTVTPRIQEVHQVAYHLICHLVEQGMFGGASSRVSG